MVDSGLQVLSYGNYVAAGAPEVLERFDDFFETLPETDHDARLGKHPGGARPRGQREKLKRPAVDRLRPYGPGSSRLGLLRKGIEPRDGFNIVIQNVGRRLYHFADRLVFPLEIRDQNFYLHPRGRLPHLVHGTREDTGAFVVPVIPVHRGYDYMRDPRVVFPEFRDRRGHPGGLFPVEFAAFSRLHVAEAAASRADVPQDHESERSGPPALPYVRALGLLAHGVKSEFAHKAFKLDVIRTARDLRLYPFGFSAGPRAGGRPGLFGGGSHFGVLNASCGEEGCSR